MKCDNCSLDLGNSKFPHPSISVCESCFPNYQTALKENPPNESKPIKVYTLYDDAKKLQKEGDINEAILLYKKVIKLFPDSHEAQAAVRELRNLDPLHDPNSLLEAARSAQKVSEPIKVYTLYDDAKKLQKEGDINEAILLYKKVIKLFPDSHEAQAAVRELINLDALRDPNNIQKSNRSANIEHNKENSLFSFKGRIRRSTFWMVIIPLFFISLVLQIAMAESADRGGSSGLVVLALIFAIPGTWASLATCVKRWHDLNKSGWMVLTQLIPFVNFLILLYLGLVPGTAGANKYGKNPADNINNRVNQRKNLERNATNDKITAEEINKDVRVDNTLSKEELAELQVQVSEKQKELEKIKKIISSQKVTGKTLISIGILFIIFSLIFLAVSKGIFYFVFIFFFLVLVLPGIIKLRKASDLEKDKREINRELEKLERINKENS